MESDIQFGDMEEARPEKRLRPDQNKHFAVVPCHDPDSGDLPVFVDLDVMRDMEAHALSDTRVELGGVLLGGQFEDEDGVPFVWVTDSLRAEHYEATKGSFKFTHETWEQISRQRDEFPPDIQMVGWYHTHPDWGVFLSGMDLFICQNFFNRKLDLALVIDPCRGDRGWFQWRDGRDQPQRTGGYFLTASRFRQAELEQFALLSRGKIPMSPDPRYSPVAGQIGPQTTYIPMAPPRQPVLEFGVLGLIGLQLTLILLLAWQVIRPTAQELAEDDPVHQQLVALNERLDELDARREAEFAADAQQQLVRDLVMAQGSSAAIADQLTELRLQNQRQKASLDSFAISGVEAQSRLNAREAEIERLKSDIEELELNYDDAKAEAKSTSGKLAELQKLIDKATGEAKINYRWYQDWLYLVVLAGVCVLSVMGGMAAATYLRSEDDEPVDEPSLPPAMTYEPESKFSGESNDDQPRS